jgi:hypothetical protein
MDREDGDIKKRKKEKKEKEKKSREEEKVMLSCVLVGIECLRVAI